MTDAHIVEERADGLSYRFRVSLPAAAVMAAVDVRLQKMGPTLTTPGFRRGRAPLAVLRNRHGRRVRTAVIDRMAIEVARQLIETKRLEPAARPMIDIDEDTEAAAGSVEFTLLLEVLPQVELAPFTGYRLKRLRAADAEPALVEDADAHLRSQLFDALLARHDFPVPPEMVDKEYARISRGFETEVGEAVDADLAQRLRPIAERRIRLAILLTEIGRVHDIRVSRSELEALIERQAERDPGHETEIIDYYLDHPSALAELQSPLFEDRIVRFLLQRCDIEEIELSADELRTALEQA